MARILLVDDERFMRRSLGEFLRLKGHDVIEAAGGGEALRLAAGETPDLVITDINMPDTDGIEVILALGARLPVIAISGGGMVPKTLLLSSASVLGAVSTLEKPFDLSDLERLVDEALSRPTQTRGDA